MLFAISRYATTVHRAQGTTVDTSHVLVHSSQMTREALYVSLTRGRHSNHAYVATDLAHLEEHQRPPGANDGEVTAKTVLSGVLQHVGAEQSAHQVAQAEEERWDSIAQLAAEYETLATAALRDRWASLLARAGLTPEHQSQILASDAFGALAAELRRAHADGHDLNRLLPRLIQARGFDDADDPAAVLHHRLTTRPGRRPAPATRRYIAGLIPEVTDPVPLEMGNALQERRLLIEQRVGSLVRQALANQRPWIRRLGAPPIDAHARHTWYGYIAIVAAYRDHYQLGDEPDPLGPRNPRDAARHRDYLHAEAAVNAARKLTARADSASPVVHDSPTVGL